MQFNIHVAELIALRDWHVRQQQGHAQRRSGSFSSRRRNYGHDSRSIDRHPIWDRQGIPMNSPQRQSGITGGQMLTAPRKAVFIWGNTALSYPRSLACTIGRPDLEIVSPHWLDQQQYRGRTFSAIIVDHAASLSDQQRFALRHARERAVLI